MRQRKKVDKAFKEQVVLRILAGDTTFANAAKELDVHYTTIRDWVKFYKHDGDSAFRAAVTLR
ncbi:MULTISPECIES: transposase [unclassified Paenibacillus]|uniref:transposase n=1 Tax=unclassified Paenibacillus TaxID=185978 RepID=UPI00362974A4